MSEAKASPGLQCGDEMEKKTAACERLMVQGVMRTSDLAKLLDLPARAVVTVKRRVLREWEEIAQSAQDSHSVGRFFRKAELVERAAWALLAEEESNEKKTNILKVVLSAIEKEIAVLGLARPKETNEQTESEKIAECERKVETVIFALAGSGVSTRSQ